MGRRGMPIRGRGVTGDRGGRWRASRRAGAAQLAGVSNEAGTAVSTVSTAVSSLGFCQVLARE